jgi:hypothetical protein
MGIQIDPEVELVAEFMTARIPVSRLAAVANALAALAPSLWGKYEPEGIEPLRFVSTHPTSSGQRLTSANE